MSEPPSAPTASSEVRVSEYAHRVMRRWYVVLVALVVAVGVVLLHGVSASHGQSDASAIVYIGQPTTPSGGAVFAYPPYSNASAVSQTVNSESALELASQASGVAVSSIRGHVAAHLLSSSTASTGGTKTPIGAIFYNIDAQGPWGPIKAAKIANSLAASVLKGASIYTNIKIAQLTAAVTSEQTAVNTLEGVNSTAQRLAARLNSNASGNPSSAAIVASLLSQISANTATIASTQEQLSTNNIYLASAKGIEAPQITTTAVGHGVSATNRRSSLVVAAGVGIIIGVALALAWDAVRPRPVRLET